jgi:D-alanyl-lipoteichoic acid acyltransferase DltB (MBOAT superfamily)
MQLCSLPFAAFAAVGLVLYHACRTLFWRRFVLLLLSAVFITSQVDSLTALLPLAGFVGVIVLSLHLVNHCKSGWLFLACLSALLALFIYLKHYVFVAFLPPLPLLYTSLGLSYILFRALHVLIDTYQEETPRNDLDTVPLLTYLTSFLSFTAGPIQRYEEFREQEQAWNEAPRLTRAAVNQALLRLATGYVKLMLLGPVLVRLHERSFDQLGHHPALFGAAAVAFMLYLYVNFSGYMDVVIGLGLLFGLKLPENFNSPLLARNYLELWTRWHITLSEWFKVYVFNPLMHTLCYRWGRPAVLPYLGVFSYFVVFFLLGLWHGGSMRYVLLGLVHGIGVSVNKLYEVEMTRRLGKARFQTLLRFPGYQTVTRAFMLTYFSLVSILAWEHVASLRLVLGGVGVGGLAASAALCFTGFVVVELVVRLAWAVGTRAASLLRVRGESAVWGHLGASAQFSLLGLFLYASLTQPQPVQERTPTPTLAPGDKAAPEPEGIRDTWIFYEGK